MSDKKETKVIHLTKEQIGPCSSGNPADLIGKPFRRNKYGLSLWEDTIKNVWIQWEVIDRNTKRPRLLVRGHMSENHYDISEIVILGEPLNFFEQAGLQKREMFQKIKEDFQKTKRNEPE